MGGLDGYGHNSDKEHEQLTLKFYSKNVNPKVLQLYNVTGIYYKSGIIHVTDCIETEEEMCEGIVGSELATLREMCKIAMYNDDIAAEFLLSSFLSQVYLR